MIQSPFIYPAQQIAMDCLARLSRPPVAKAGPECFSSSASDLANVGIGFDLPRTSAVETSQVADFAKAVAGFDAADDADGVDDPVEADMDAFTLALIKLRQESAHAAEVGIVTDEQFCNDDTKVVPFKLLEDMAASPSVSWQRKGGGGTTRRRKNMACALLTCLTALTCELRGLGRPLKPPGFVVLLRRLL